MNCFSATLILRELLMSSLRNSHRGNEIRANHPVSGVWYPHLPAFVKFLENMAEMKNDLTFHFERRGGKKHQNLQCQQPKQAVSKLPVYKTTQRTTVAARKTETNYCFSTTEDVCPLHKNNSFNDCKSFRQMSIGEQKMILNNWICSKCCSGKKHRGKNWRADVNYNVCCASSHPTALHKDVTGEQT